jgi:hypothetical protein
LKVYFVFTLMLQMCKLLEQRLRSFNIQSIQNRNTKAQCLFCSTDLYTLHMAL